MAESRNAGILGIGLCIPENVIKNNYWDDKPFLNLPKNKEREDVFIGIQERRYFSLDTKASDVETEAGKKALENAGLKPEDIDLVICHSMIPDEIVPNNASLVQYKLGLVNAGAWNMDTCCSSFITMFICASNMIKAGTFKKILIITSIMHSKIIDENDYLSPHAGDGASAVVMGEVSEGRGYLSCDVSSHGYYHDSFTVRERYPLAAQYRASHESSPARNLMTTNPVKTREMGRKSIDHMTPIMLNALSKASLTSNDLDFFFSHQPCNWAHDAWRDSIKVPSEKSLQTFHLYGNLASTSIPTSMFHAIQEGKIKDGDVIMLASSGAGENHASAIFVWGK
jgi:3-oxoacyl-[acyl-carrier-protein] synthase-3